MKNEDEIKGKAKKIEGKIQEEVGKTTDDEEEQVKEKMKQIECQKFINNESV